MFRMLGISFAAGIVGGLLLRGRPGNLRTLQLRYPVIAFVSVVIALVPLFVTLGDGVRITIQILTNLGVLAFLVLNLPGRTAVVRWGFLVIGIGWALNFVVIAANGAMPLSLWALEQAGITEAPTPGEGGFFKIEIAGEGTVLRFLGDVIPLRAFSQVLSIGDLFLMAGIAMVVAGGMRAPERVPSDA